MSTHVIQVRDLIEQLAQHRAEAKVVFVVGETEFNFDITRKSCHGEVEVCGSGETDPDVILELEEEIEALKESERGGDELLERFIEIMNANFTDEGHRLGALIELKEEVDTHLE